MTDPEEAAPKKRRSRLTWILGGMLAVLILAAVVVEGAAYVYIHFIEGPAPKSLTLPSHTSTSKDTTPAAASTVTGTWTATSKSTVQYRVNEVLAGQNNVAVGSTHSVKGSMTLRAAEADAASFTVQMATVHSDQSQRDQQFDGRIMEVSRYPTATFTLTSPINLGTIPSPGTVVHETATGNLTLHGQTHPVTFMVSAERLGTAIDINGSIPITFATWDIGNPSFGSFVTTANHGTLEFLLVMEHGGAS